MAVNTSVKDLTDMKNLINNGAKEIFALNEKLTQFMNKIDWSDEKGTQFLKAVKELNTKLLEPLPTLKQTRDTVEKLIKIVEKYNKITF